MHAADDSAPLERDLPDEAATLAFGAALARALAPGVVIRLEGDLGAGKTTLVRGVLRGLGFEGRVRSPTYTLVEPYAISSLEFHHFDFYRFNHPDEYIEAGLDEFFGGDAVCLVEWPDKAGAHLPPADLAIRLVVVGEGRRVRVAARTQAGARCLNALSAAIGATS